MSTFKYRVLFVSWTVLPISNQPQLSTGPSTGAPSDPGQEMRLEGTFSSEENLTNGLALDVEVVDRILVRTDL